MVNDTVLVLDEDRDCRMAVGELLENEGMRSTLVGTAGAALASLAKAAPSLIVMDLPIPGTASNELLTALRARERSRRPPVVIFTAWSDAAVSSRLNLPVVQKPDIAALLSAIGAARCA